VWRLGILAVLVGFLALFLTPTLRGYLEQRAEINRMEQQITQEQDAIVELEEQVAAWDDEDYVEQQARQRLRFVKPGETAFTVVDDTGEQLTEPVPGVASVTDEVLESRPWYGEVWESVMTANEGLPEDDGVPQP
jgi:cell division protein FtsB